MGTRVAPQLLAAGVALGVGWHILQETVPAQLDVALGFGLLFIVLVILHGRGLLHIPDSDRALLGIPALLFLGTVVWRDSEALVLVNLLALAGLMAFARPVRVGSRAPLLNSRPGDLIGRVIHAARGAAAGAWPLLAASGGPEWQRTEGKRWSAGLGVVAVSPVLILFSVLLGSADPVFAQLMGRAFDVEVVATHVMPTLFFSWVAAGILWSLTRPPSANEVTPRGGMVSTPAITGALAPIAILFLVFLVLQSRYLFGGRAVVMGTPELSFSDYARGGFFELVTVSALMLPILLVADWAASQHSDAERRRFRFLARCLLVLLSGLLGSALMRMAMYTSEYGLTEQRLFATIFMGWLAMVFGWFGASILRGRRERFTAGALGSALAILLLVDLSGTDGIIVRTNVWRAEHGRPLDTVYLASLGAGAVPAALQTLANLPTDLRCDAAGRLLDRWSDAESTNRAWNIERWRASSALKIDLRREMEASCPGGWH